MKGKIGCPTRIVTPIPYMRELAKSENKELSKKATFRLKPFDWYFRQSARFSGTGLPDASLTCRHFGVHRSYFYCGKNRCDKTRLPSLENKPTKPAKKRPPCYPRELARAVRGIREENPTHSGKKYAPSCCEHGTMCPASPP